MVTKTLLNFSKTDFKLSPSLKLPVRMTDHLKLQKNQRIEVLFITTFTPRECGIATYTEDLIHSISKGFDKSFNISICALTSDQEVFQYSKR